MIASIAPHSLANVPSASPLGSIADDAAEEAPEATDEIAEEADEAPSDVVELPQALTLSANTAAAQAVRTVFPPTVTVFSFPRFYGS
jgi:hypothetical protein